MPRELALIAAAVLVALPAGGSHPYVARLVATPPSSRRLLLALGVVAAVAILAAVLGFVPPPAAIVLAAPAYQALLLRFLCRDFVARWSREPVDVAFNLQPGLGRDRFFLGLFPPAALFYWSTWGRSPAA